MSLRSCRVIVTTHGKKDEVKSGDDEEERVIGGVADSYVARNSESFYL